MDGIERVTDVVCLFFFFNYKNNRLLQWYPWYVRHFLKNQNHGKRTKDENRSMDNGGSI